MVESLPMYDVMNMVSNKVFSLSQVDSGFPNVSLEKVGSTFITKFTGMSWYVQKHVKVPTGVGFFQTLYHKSRQTPGRRSQ